MTVKDLIQKVQKYPEDMEVGCMWNRECRDGWQEMCRRVEGVEIRGVTGADVLCKGAKSDSQDSIFVVKDKVVIL